MFPLQMLISTINTSIPFDSSLAMQTPEMTKTYLYFMDITFAISLPLHLVTLAMAIFYTPVEMFCYKVRLSLDFFNATTPR